MHKFDFEEHGRVFVPILIKPFDEVTLIPVGFKENNTNCELGQQ